MPGRPLAKEESLGNLCGDTFRVDLEARWTRNVKPATDVARADEEVEEEKFKFTSWPEKNLVEI